MRTSLPIALVVLFVAAAALPAAAVAATGPLAGVTVNVEPGHNPGNARNAARINRIVQRGPIRKACDTVGATDGRGFAEWRLNGQVATRLARRLRAHGATVTFTRRNGRPAWGPCITRRADSATGPTWRSASTATAPHRPRAAST